MEMEEVVVLEDHHMEDSIGIMVLLQAAITEMDHHQWGVVDNLWWEVEEALLDQVILMDHQDTQCHFHPELDHIWCHLNNIRVVHHQYINQINLYLVVNS